MKRTGIIFRISVSITFACSAIHLYGGNTYSAEDSIRVFFDIGNIISVSGNVACYQVDASQEQKAYGYCIYDSLYTPKFSEKSQFYLTKEGIVTLEPNSKCYTIIAPVFNKALPFSEGWGAVCLGNKWSYISFEGTLMCDFVLDAASPFQNGWAEIIYDGKSYRIDTFGNHLPEEVNKGTGTMSRLIRGATVLQLYSEGQYEKVMEKGMQLYSEIIHDNMDEVSYEGLLSAAKAQSVAMTAQSSLMAMTCDKSPSAYDYYRDITIERRLSTESGLYALNLYNMNYYLPLFRNRHSSDSTVSKIVTYADELNFKSAIILFEKWINEKGLPKHDIPIELLTYYYLAELSDDFETANNILLDIAELYETHIFDWINTYRLGHILSNIKRNKSAEQIFLKEVQTSNPEDNVERSVVCHYRLALLYASTNHIQKSISHYEKAIELVRSDSQQAIMPEIKNEIMAEYLVLLLQNNMFEGKRKKVMNDYTRLEIDYNSKLFSQIDNLHINRLWGKSLLRIQRILSCLDYCNDADYIQNVFRLTFLQNTIVNEAEKYFLSGIQKTSNQKIKTLYPEYLDLKRQSKGVNVFDLDESDSQQQKTVERLCKIEEEIKLLLQKEYDFDYENIIANSLRDINENDVVVSIVEYGELVKQIGALVVRGDPHHISFIPMGKIKYFAPKDFWKKLITMTGITPQDQCFLYTGKMDNYAFEYERTDDENIMFLKYHIHRVASLSKIKSRPDTKTDNQLALFGGLYYGDEHIAQERGAIDTGFLEYSKTEVDKVSETMKTKMSISTFSGTKGTPKAFMELCRQSPAIIHFATHGYQDGLKNKKWENNVDRFNFYKQNTDVEDLDWLMNNTGLYLSYTDEDTPNILSSREVASSDLSSTKLVVLSACSTLSGEISDNYTESVGLTTAFSIAQAQNIITSFHDVDDEKTCEFMSFFYEQLKETDNIYDSFRNTINEMFIKYPNQKDFWGAFILLENH